jgi:S-adenosylmethionine decarboxylase
VVEAHGCDAVALRDASCLQALFSDLINELELKPLGEQAWHKFPGEGGVTGLVLLTESHLTCHTFPEYRSLCLNLFCCRPRPEWDFEQRLRERFGANTVQVRRIERLYQA